MPEDLKDGTTEGKAISRRKARRKIFEILFEMSQRRGSSVAEMLKRCREMHADERPIGESDPVKFSPEDDENFVVGKMSLNNLLFIESICKGTTEHREEIDKCLQDYPWEWSFDRIGAPERTILRMALYELVFMDTPYKIVINEALDLAKTYGERDANKFLNGILGSVVKDLPKLREKLCSEAN
jgi:N utilization substance protein B